MSVQVIGHDELERLLLSASRCQFVSLSTITDPDMRTTDNPFAGLNGDSLAAWSASSEYAFPTPAKSDCSVSTPLI